MDISYLLYYEKKKKIKYVNPNLRAHLNMKDGGNLNIK